MQLWPEETALEGITQKTPQALTSACSGGKHYSRDVQPVDKDGNPVSMWRV